MPRGKRPSTAALTRSGARNASEHGHVSSAGCVTAALNSLSDEWTVPLREVHSVVFVGYFLEPFLPFVFFAGVRSFFSRGLRVFLSRTGGARTVGVNIFAGGFSPLSMSPGCSGTGDVVVGSDQGQISATSNVPLVSTKRAMSAGLKGLLFTVAPAGA